MVILCSEVITSLPVTSLFEVLVLKTSDVLAASSIILIRARQHLMAYRWWSQFVVDFDYVLRLSHHRSHRSWP